jgi:CRP/FNR family transcriptional regulator
MAHPLLLQHPLFRGAREARIGPILAGVQPRTIPKGSLLNTPGSSPALLHLLLEGRFQSFQLASDGRQLLLELIETGGFDGLLSVAGRHGHFTETLQDSLVAALPWPVLEQLLQAEPRIAVNLIQLVATRLENREDRLELLALRDPGQRLARQLLALGETLGRREGKWIVLKPRLTHQMLADMLGIRRETVTIHLRQLTKPGAVQATGGRISLNSIALRKLIRGARGTSTRVP